MRLIRTRRRPRRPIVPSTPACFEEAHMSSYFRWPLFLLLVWSSPCLADSEPKQAASKSRNVEVRLSDGSTVRMVIAQDGLVVATKYGKLTVATDDITQIEFGMRVPEGVGAKVEQAIKRLGSAEFKEREAASAELLELGVHAY